MAEQVQLQRVPNVLQASIGTSSKRERRVGRYHLSDLMGLGAEACARLYAGLEQEDDFPAYLAKRGLILEQMALGALPENQRQAEVLYEIKGLQIVGHPDGVTLDENGNPVLIEVASQLSEEDADKEETKLDQVLGYAGLVNEGASLSLQDGTPVPGRVEEVRIVLCGLWAGQEIPYTDIQGQARERAEWLVSKAILVDDLAHALMHASGVGSSEEDHKEIQAVVDKPLAAARRWDERFPARAGFETEAAPVLEGERGELADQTVQVYKQWKWAEERFKEDHRKRWLATLDLDTLKKVKAPGGGTITLRKKTVKELDGEVFNKLGGTRLELELARAREDLEKDLADYRIKLQEAAENHPLSEEVERLEEALDDVKQRATRQHDVPNGLLVTPPRGWKKDMEA